MARRRPRKPADPSVRRTQPPTAQRSAAGARGGAVPWFGLVGVLMIAAALWRLDAAPAPALPAVRPSTRLDDGPRVPGALRVRTIELAQPPYNENAAQCEVAESRWVFARATADDVRAQLRGAGFSDATRDALLEHMRCDGTGCVIDAPDALLRTLAATPRGRLYRSLGPTQGQMFAALPHRRPRELPPWPALARSPAVASVLVSLAWAEDDAWYLADVATACRALSDVAQRVELLSILRRRYGLDVALQLRPDDPVDAVARYWTLPGASPDPSLRARLEGAQRAGAPVPLRALLSGWPARRLDTYPAEQEPDRDCFWSTLHFHDPSPERYEVPSPEAFFAELTAGWREVPAGDERFGDAVVFMNGSAPLHAAIVLADDIIFTKNGRARSRPWIASRLDVTLRDYPSRTATRYFRRAPR